MSSRISLSLEFFPPKTPEASEKLLVTANRLREIGPEYVSVTYGAGGSTREGSLGTVRQLMPVFSQVAPHISCVGATTAQIEELLGFYESLGIQRLVALRGDLPSAMVKEGSSSMPSIWCALFASATVSRLALRWLPIRRSTPRPRPQKMTFDSFQKKCRQEPIAPLPNIFSIQMPTLDLSMTLLRLG